MLPGNTLGILFKSKFKYCFKVGKTTISVGGKTDHLSFVAETSLLQTQNLLIPGTPCVLVGVNIILRCPFDFPVDINRFNP